MKVETMTLREQFAQYLTDNGYTRIFWSDRSWVFSHPQKEAKVYLGKAGSFRAGTTKTASRAISDKARERILNRFVGV
jgi:hypothetical protein